MLGYVDLFPQKQHKMFHLWKQLAAYVSMSSIDNYLRNAETHLECQKSFCFILARLSVSYKLLKLLFVNV
jgi:hypothetical protein